jgi:hypothetical protein
MTQDDRRFFVLQVSDAKAKDPAYFAPLFELAENPQFLQHLLSYLLDYDCSGFNTHVPPMTDVKRDMIEATEDYSLQYIKLRRWRKGTTDHAAWVPFSRQVWQDYLEWLTDEVGADSAKVAGPNNRFTAPLILGKWIEKRGKPVEIRPGANLLKIWEAEDEKAKKEKEDRLRQDLLAEEGNSEEDVELTLEFRRKREELEELSKRMKKSTKE